MIINKVRYFIYKLNVLYNIENKTLAEKVDMYRARDKGIPFCLYEDYVIWRENKLKEDHNAD